MKTTITKKEKKTTKTTAKKATKTDKKNAYLSQVITADNIQILGEQTAQKALKTIYRKSADKLIQTLIKDLQIDKLNKNNIKHTFSNAYDIAQTAITFYCDYIGQQLNASANNGELKVLQDEKNKPILDENGKKQYIPIDIYRACLRKLNRYILENKNKVFKTVYLEDIDENGENIEYIEVPKKWDTPTITDYKQVIQTIKNMNLSVMENKVLYARLRGYGYKTIAKKLSISTDNVKTYCKRMQGKLIKLDIMPKSVRKTLNK